MRSSPVHSRVSDGPHPTHRNIVSALRERSLSIDMRHTRANSSVIRWLCGGGMGLDASSPDSCSSRSLGLSTRFERGFDNVRRREFESALIVGASGAAAAAATPNTPPAHPFVDDEYRGMAEQLLVRVDSRHPRGSTLCMDQARSGAELASGHGDHHVRIWSLSSHGSSLRFTLAGHSRTPCTLRYHPCLEHLLASGDLAGEVMIWDTARGTRLAAYDFRRPSVVMERIASLSWYPSTRQLCLGIVHRRLCYFWPVTHSNETLTAMPLTAENSHPDTLDSEDQLPTQSLSNGVASSLPTPGVPPAVSTCAGMPLPNALSVARLEHARYESRKRQLERELDEDQEDERTQSNKRQRIQQNTDGQHSNSTHQTMPSSSSSAHPAAAATVTSPHPDTDIDSDSDTSSPRPSDWPDISDRIAAYIGSASTAATHKPIPMMKAQLAWRYIHFHQNGDYLLLAHRSPCAPSHNYERNSMILRIYSLSQCDLNPETHKHEMKLLCTLTRILFFSEGGVSVSGDKLATCQWAEPPTTTTTTTTTTTPSAMKSEHVPASGSAAVAPNDSMHRPATVSTQVPTLVIFDLRVGHIGEPLMRLELNAFSFADLTSVAFSPYGGEYLAVAYQVSNKRASRRQLPRAYDVLSRLTGSNGNTMPSIHQPSRSRFSALSSLTRMIEEEEPTDTSNNANNNNAPPAADTGSSGGDHQQNGSNHTEHTNETDVDPGKTILINDDNTHPNGIGTSVVVDSLPPTLDSSRYRRTTSYDTPLSQSLEDHTFLSFYRSRDLLPLRQLTVGRGSSAAASHSVNVLIYSRQPTVGVITGCTNGDIMTCTPITKAIDDTPTSTGVVSTTPLRPHRSSSNTVGVNGTGTGVASSSMQLRRTMSMEFDGRHKIPPYVMDDIGDHTPRPEGIARRDSGSRMNARLAQLQTLQ